MWNLQLNDSYLSRAHNFLFSELFHMYNLIWAHSPAPNPEMCMSFINLWNQISHKGQVFLDRKPPDCKLHRNDNTNVQMHGHRGKEKKNVCTIQPRYLPVPHIHSLALPLSSPACAGGCLGLSQGWQSTLLILAAGEPVPPAVSVTRCWVICTATRSSWRALQHVMKKRNCILGHPGIFLLFCVWWGGDPYFS